MIQLSNILNQQNIEKLLLKFGNINIEIVNNILMKLNIVPHSFIDSMFLPTKILLGIELARLDFPNILLFETSGLDPLGINTVCKAILEKLDICTFAHFSLSYIFHETLVVLKVNVLKFIN